MQPAPGTVPLSLACLVEPPPMARRDDPTGRQRAERMAVALLLLSGAIPPEKIAVMFAVSKATLYRWSAWATSDANPDAETFRRLVARRGRIET